MDGDGGVLGSLPALAPDIGGMDTWQEDADAMLHLAHFGYADAPGEEDRRFAQVLHFLGNVLCVSRVWPWGLHTFFGWAYTVLSVITVLWNILLVVMTFLAMGDASGHPFGNQATVHD
jgi:hypothetical protein